MTLADDSMEVLGRYECHAFAIGEYPEQSHGFSVSVISGKFSEMFLVTFSSFLAVTIHDGNKRIYVFVNSKKIP